MSVIALPSSDSTVVSRTRRGPYQPSPKRISANRLNAKKSTGPRTPEGKSKVSHNALKHGLSVVQPLCHPYSCDPDTDPDFALFLDELKSDLKPATPTQHHLFPLIADLLWRLRRLPPTQQLLFSNPDQPACDQLATAFLSGNPNNPFLLLARYERSLQNALCRLLTQFRTITKELTKNPRAQYAPDEPPCPPERAWPYPDPITKQTHSEPTSPNPQSEIRIPQSLPRLPDNWLTPDNLPYLTRDEIRRAIAAGQLPATFTRPPIPPGAHEDGDDETYNDEFAPTKQTHSPRPFPNPKSAFRNWTPRYPPSSILYPRLLPLRPLQRSPICPPTRINYDPQHLMGASRCAGEQ